MDTGTWNPSSCKTRTCLFYIVNFVGADVLVTQEARASTIVYCIWDLDMVVITELVDTQHLKVESRSNIDGLAQDCSNSSALAMELLQSCTKPSNYVLIHMC